jgi:amino acid adenylation domain-containing protein
MSTAELRPLIFDDTLKAEKDYWIERLSGERGLSNLRLDFERAERASGNKQTVEIAIPADLFQTLSRVSNNSHFLCYTILLAALKVCLHKYTGSRTVVVGSPSRRAEGESIKEANALVLVDEIDANFAFSTFLSRVRETLVEAYARQRYPFERLVRDVARGAVENRCPMFDVALALRNIHHQLPEVKNDITISLEMATDGLKGVIEYESALFQRESIERFARHYVALLRHALENVHAPIRALDMLQEDERRQLLVEWNDTETENTSGKCVHELFEEQVARTPDALAVVDEEQQLSYAELNRRANQLAHYLSGAGVETEVLVGFCLERSAETVIAMLGILKAGGAYLPLDPGYPKERLAYMLQDSQARFLLTLQRTIETLPAGDARVIALDAEAGEIAQKSALNPVSGTTSENLAYVIYTSGSTGQPKGVMAKHGGLRNLASAQIKAFHLTPESRVLQFASLSFDASVSEVFTALLSGATLCFGKREDMYAGAKIIQVMREMSVTTVTLPPALITTLPANETPALETLISAGEICSADIVNRWSEGRHFINAYGPTETTVCASLLECAGSYSASPPIGRPIDNIQIYLLDGDGKPVPVGAQGELYVGGAGVTRGYWKQPELTAEKFLPHPFSREPGLRLYRTGDLARYLPEGNIEFLGRIDQQVKIDGFRIEPGEVEHALKLSPSVRNAVVIDREDTPGEKRLVAYVVLNPEQPIGSSELRALLRQSVPEYMLPSAFVILEELPLTPSGKIDRRKLPAPEQVSSDEQSNFVAPRTPTEQILADIWAEVLGLERVGIHDNFFDLGGRSLLVAQVIARVLDDFKVELPVRVMFESPTVAELNIALLEYQAGQVGADGMAELLAEIEGLSENEAEAMITDNRQESPASPQQQE